MDEIFVQQSDTEMWINPSKSLVDRALYRWSMTRLRADNTSVVTLMLDPPTPTRAEVKKIISIIYLKNMLVIKLSVKVFY